MLKEDPRNRPNIYQVLRESCSMRGKEVPIRDVSTVHGLSQILDVNVVPDICKPFSVRIPPVPTASLIVG